MTPSSDVSFQDEIARGYVILIMLAFPASYHFVLASQYDSTQANYTVQDPEISKPFTTGYGSLATAYGRGTLARAWSVGRRRVL